MNPFAHRQARAELDALFVGRPASGVLEARAHLESCAACRAHFERLAAVDRAAMGDADTSGPFERSFTRACVEAALGDGAARRRPQRGWITLAAAVTVVGLGVGTWRLTSSEAPRSQARGSAGAGVHAIELLCVDPARREVSPAGASPEHRLACPLAGELKIAVMNTVPEGAPPLPYLTLASVAADGVAHPLLPVEPQSGSVSMVVGEHPRMTGVGAGLRLAINHRPGAWRVRAWFTASPLSAAELESRLAASDTNSNDTWSLLVTP